MEGRLVKVIESPWGLKYIVAGLEKEMVHELDTVVITKDLAASGIVAGDVGVVAHVYAGDNVAEVEFISGAGHGLRPLLASGGYRRRSRGTHRQHASGEGITLALETLPITDIRPVGAREILHARSLETA